MLTDPVHRLNGDYPGALAECFRPFYLYGTRTTYDVPLFMLYGTRTTYDVPLFMDVWYRAAWTSGRERDNFFMPFVYHFWRESGSVEEVEVITCVSEPYPCDVGECWSETYFAFDP